MHEIKLYELNLETGATQQHVHLMPAGWDELSAEQLKVVSEARFILFACGEEYYTEVDAAMRFRLLQQLAGIPDRLMRHMPDAGDLTFETEPTADDLLNGRDKPRFKLMAELDWVFAAPKYDKSLLPALEHDGSIWNGPDDFLNHMNLDQWSWVTSLVNALRNPDAPPEAPGEPARLDMVMGAMYTPDGRPFDSLIIEVHAARFATMPLGEKLAALLNYEALYASVPEQYPRVFPYDNEGRASPFGPFGTIIDIAKNGVLGDRNAAQKERMHDGMMLMEHSLFQQEESERQAKKK